jgi:CBS domain containing-hemolysin-like protein
VEEIVGEIFDEQEREEAPELEATGAGTWRVAGLLPLSDLYAELGVDAKESPAETVAGHVAHHLGRLPRPGDIVKVGPVTFRVAQVRRHRADRVEVSLDRERGGDP